MSVARVSSLLAAVLVCATACGAGDDLRRSLATPPVPATTAAGVPARTAGPDPDAPATACTGERLAVSLGPPTVTGDTVTQDVIFQNTGPGPCVTRGFPLVVAVAGNEGRPVGDPALPLGERGQEVRLAPRGAAVAALTVRAPASYGDCGALPVRGLRVIPAGGSGAVFVPREGTACQAVPPDRPQARIGTVTPR